MFSKLLQPGESVDFNAGGSWVRLDSGSKVQVVTGNGHRAQLYERDSAQFTPFREITVTNKSTVAETIEIRVSTGQIVGAGDGDVVSLATGTEVAVTGPVSVDALPAVDINSMPAFSISATVNQSNTVSDMADVSLTAAVATVIAAVNANRKELMIKNPSSNTASIRIGGATVAAAQGFELEPGESTIITTTAAVYGYSTPGESVSVTELEFV